MIEKSSIYAINALNKSSELWYTSVNCKARPVVEGEHDKKWNDHGSRNVYSKQHSVFDLFTKSRYRSRTLRVMPINCIADMFQIGLSKCTLIFLH